MDLIYRYDPFKPVQVDVPNNAEEALASLMNGNRRMTALVERMQKKTLGEEVEQEVIVPMCPMSLGLPLFDGAVISQQPFALFLGCADARVPIEPIFDMAFNALFVVRIAGNVLGTECLGSVDYAVRHLSDSLKLVVVLGHTGCGAVAAAVETYLTPKDFADIAFTHALRSLVDRIMIAVRGAAAALDHVCGRTVNQHPRYKDALKELAVYLNAAITAFDLQREVASAGGGDLRVVYGVYELTSLRVKPFPTTKLDGAMFADAPKQEALTELALTLARDLVETGILGNRQEFWSKIV